MTAKAQLTGVDCDCTIVIVLNADIVKLSFRSLFLNSLSRAAWDWLRLFNMTMRGSLTVIVGRFE